MMLPYNFSPAILLNISQYNFVDEQLDDLLWPLRIGLGSIDITVPAFTCKELAISIDSNFTNGFSVPNNATPKLQP